MLIDLIQSGFDRYLLIQVLLSIPVIMFALCVHECSHGYAAKLMGDPTAYNLGRLTLNPIKHIDPLGGLMMLLVGFGWAKPVPINSRYFKNPKWGMAISALAGPVSNLLFAYIFFWGKVAVCNAFDIFEYGGSIYAPPETGTFVIALYLLCEIGILLNLSLAVFNLLPVPPLDGSRILFVLLPERAYFAVMQYEQYISIAIMIMLFTGVLTAPLSALRSMIYNFFEFTVSWMV